ncbi:hypothetical protein MML48_1g18959 [Holotrichia oblita]|uniref:Uncharacterized protein n=1 Tax=Holotrichia oblita TaxID=644536 RepID=A0ACB9TSA9_HOLOL|nr:hypothetical protein MML48_1g18959 [Holotrichia oblita]
MFTDLPHVPKHQVAVRPNMTIPSYKPIEELHHENNIDVQGIHRHRYFQQPVPRTNAVLIPTLSLTIEPSAEEMGEEEQKTVRIRCKTFNKKIQTMYRESSAQTSPWQPDYKVIDGSDPEILKLDFLKWGAGLPIGIREVKLIERARMKRQWEKALPPAADAKSLTKRRNIIDAMEREEWAFREQEIEEVQTLRMDLLEKMLAELLENTKTRSEKKMRMFCQMKLAEREEKLAKLKKLSTREKRRLEFNHRGIIMKYNPMNVLDEHADYKSELYAPMMRHGVHPKRQHQVIDDHLRKYRAHYKGVDKYTTLPTWLERGPKLSDDCVKLPGTRLCIRETKWTNPVLKQLHLELKS